MPVTPDCALIAAARPPTSVAVAIVAVTVTGLADPSAFGAPWIVNDWVPAVKFARVAVVVAVAVTPVEPEAALMPLAIAYAVAPAAAA